jgi:tryptophan synthase alpha chain
MIGLYIAGGYPDIKKFEEVFEFLQTSKAAFIEVGLPFNDPVADGPVIAEAINKVVDNKVNLEEILSVVRNKKKKKCYVMTYANIIYKYGLEKFSKVYGDILDGLIIADLPNRLHSFFYSQGLSIHIIPFVTPESRLQDLVSLKNLKGDFIYFISTRGTTGGSVINLEEIGEKAKYVKKFVPEKKLYLGFGIKNYRDVMVSKEFFDGVIIGTSIVERQKDLQLLKEYIESINIL